MSTAILCVKIVEEVKTEDHKKAISGTFELPQCNTTSSKHIVRELCNFQTKTNGIHSETNNILPFLFLMHS